MEFVVKGKGALTMFLEVHWCRESRRRGERLKMVKLKQDINEFNKSFEQAQLEIAVVYEAYHRQNIM